MPDGEEPSITTDGVRRFRLVASDLDGTLLDSQGKVSEGTMDVLQQIVGTDCPLLLATARGIREDIPYERLPGPLYIAAAGGAHGLERVAGTDGAWVLQELYLETLSISNAEAAISAADAIGATIWLCQADKIYVKAAEGSAELSEKLFRKNPSHTSYAIGVNELESAVADDRTVEVVAVIADADMAAVHIEEALHAAGIHSIDVLSMAPDPLVSMKAAGVDKSLALQRFCCHLGITPQEVVAFGDGGNDVPMLRLSGLGVAVANAGERAKSAADVVSEWSNTDDAVAQELLRFRASGRL